MLNGTMPSAFAMAGTAVFRIVVSSDCMKKATATSHGKMRRTASIEIAEGTGATAVTTAAPNFFAMAEPNGLATAVQMRSFLDGWPAARVPGVWTAARGILSIPNAKFRMPNLQRPSARSPDGNCCPSGLHHSTRGICPVFQ